MSEALGIFKCVVITPKAKVLDCKTCSVVLPAHDGQVGILRNHMPMLVELGLGMMEVREAAHEDCATSKKTLLLVDGGFARVNNNLVTILAYDVVTKADIKVEQVDKLKTKSQGGQMAGELTRKELLTLQLAEHIE